MNPREQRTLRAIEKNLAADDPALAELLNSHGRRGVWLHRSAGALAVLFMLLAVVLGDAVLMLTAGLLALGAVLARAVQAVQSDRRDRSR